MKLIVILTDHLTRMAKNEKVDPALTREQAKLQYESDNLVARMQHIAKYAESVTAETVKQFAARYDNISYLVYKFDDLQLKIVDFNSRVYSLDHIIDLETSQLQFDDLVYASRGMYLQLTESSIVPPEVLDVKPTINVPLPKISIPKFNGNLREWHIYGGFYIKYLWRNNGRLS